jgi:TetR/AcrR family transcriptional regulator, transcriptional repressor for nem operon
MNDSKEHIIKIACKLFLRKSFKEVTMKELVKSTGLSKGAFYHYFESKEQLFLAVLEYFFSTIMVHNYSNYSKESFYQFYNDYANEIKSYTRVYLTEFLDEDESDVEAGEFTMNYFTLAFDALKLFPEFRERLVIEQKQEQKIWTDVIADARIKGEIRSAMTDEEIAQLFIFSSDGVAMHMVMAGMRVEEMVEPFMNLWNKLYDQIKA